MAVRGRYNSNLRVWAAGRSAEVLCRNLVGSSQRGHCPQLATWQVSNPGFSAIKRQLSKDKQRLQNRSKLEEKKKRNKMELREAAKKNRFFLGNLSQICLPTHPPQGFCEIWENERWNLGRKRRFSGQFGGVLKGLDLVWESAAPPPHIWERSPKKKRFFFWQSPLTSFNKGSAYWHPLGGWQ